MGWQLQRGVLDPIGADPPGSPWWRAVNAQLLQDGCEAAGIAAGRPGDPSSSAVECWVEFVISPTAAAWYRAHNSSIVAGYLKNEDLAAAESPAERFFMNVALLRVLYAHSLVAAPRLAVGRFAMLGRLLGDPRIGMAGAFLSLGRVLPTRYPLANDVSAYIDDEHNLGRMLDYAVILPRVESLYAWSSQILNEPVLTSFAEDGLPCYATPLHERQPLTDQPLPWHGKALRSLTAPRR